MQMTSEQFQALGDWIMKEAAYMVSGSNRSELEASNARKEARRLFVENPMQSTTCRHPESARDFSTCRLCG